MERFFAVQSDDPEARQERLDVLEAFLSEYRVFGDVDQMLHCYNDWKNSNRVVWPFAGGRLQQPLWVLHNWRIFEAQDELHDLRRKRGDSEDDEDADDMKVMDMP